MDVLLRVHFVTKRNTNIEILNCTPFAALISTHPPTLWQCIKELGLELLWENFSSM